MASRTRCPGAVSGVRVGPAASVVAVGPIASVAVVSEASGARVPVPSGTPLSSPFPEYIL